MAEPLLNERKVGIFNLPKLPVAGFIYRVLAVTVDLALVVSAINLASRLESVEAALFSLGRDAKFISAYFLFMYFFLFNGPFGKGRTIGKMIMGIRVANYDNSPITWRQSLIRTAILYPVYITWPFVTIFADRTSMMGLYVENLFTSLLQVSMLVATALLIPLNPYKQGLHDYVAETLVKRNEQLETMAELHGKMGPNWNVLHRQPQFSGAVSFGIVFIFFAVVTFPARNDDEAHEFRQLLLSPRLNTLTSQVSVTPRYLRDGIMETRAEWLNGPVPAEAGIPTLIYIFSEPKFRTDEAAERMLRLLVNNHLDAFVEFERTELQRRVDLFQADRDNPRDFPDRLFIVFLYQSEMWLPPSPQPTIRERFAYWTELSLSDSRSQQLFEETTEIPLDLPVEN